MANDTNDSAPITFIVPGVRQDGATRGASDASALALPMGLRGTVVAAVRIRNGKLSTTDGPFAETKEQLGGYYLIEAKDLNEAIQVGSRIPGARVGSIEVRPIVGK